MKTRDRARASSSREFTRTIASVSTRPSCVPRIRRVTGDFRANGGPALDLRAQRLALGSAPLLVEHRVVRNEARATVEVPLGRLRARGTTRLGVLQALGEVGNQRLENDGALVLPLGTSELSAQYHTISYDHAAASGYFAPRRVQSMEGGWYFERGDGVAHDLVSVGRQDIGTGQGLRPRAKGLAATAGAAVSWRSSARGCHAAGRGRAGTP